MYKYLLLFVLFGFTLPCSGQSGTSATNRETPDSLQHNKFSLDLDVLFYLSQQQFDEHTDLKFVNGLKMNYLVNTTEYSLYFRQVLDRDPDGGIYSNHYLNLSSALNKYKPTPQKGAFLRYLRPEFVFIFQNNSGRGLQKRFQTGVFLYPLRHFRAQFKLNVGLGCLYDWSSWEVNNRDKIAARSVELQDKIVFVNSHSKLRRDLYMDFSEWRPTLFLTLHVQMSDALAINLFSSYQQSLVSPFNKEIRTAYPELGKVYPYAYSDLSIVAKVYKKLSLKTSFILDYENNNLSIYDSSWGYSLIIGATWNFSSKASLWVTHPKKRRSASPPSGTPQE